jgi:hypothetical protein
MAQPFAWTFTRTDLDAVHAMITEHEPKLTLRGLSRRTSG